MNEAIRHCVRNLDFTIEDHYLEPVKYAGFAIAQIINLVPAIVKTLKQKQQLLYNREASEQDKNTATKEQP